MRQLNFYNFRKVNRERNFWVYKHLLFHRDRPGDLHLLRRRTCPGVDGRKIKLADLANMEQRSETSTPPPVTVSADNSETVSQSDSDGGNSISVQPKKRKYTKRKQSDPGLSLADDRTALKVANSSMFPTYIRDDCETAKKESSEGEDWVSTAEKYMKGPKRLVSPMSEPKRIKADLMEQSLLVSKVAKQLEEHARRAASSGRLGSKKRTGTVTPPYATDVKYHSLTYDDEVEIFDSIRGCVVERRTYGSDTNDDDDSDASSENNASIISLNESDIASADPFVPTSPIEDASVIEEVARKLLSTGGASISRDAQLTVAIAKFCMMTDPRDPALGEKAIDLMSVHGDLAHEFCLYKIALRPNHKLSMSDQHAAFMRDIFQGSSREVVQGFKTFVLNNLNELVRYSKTVNWIESEPLMKCYDVWFAGVTASA